MTADDQIDPHELARDLVGQHQRAKRRREKTDNNGKAQATPRKQRRIANTLALVTFISNQPEWDQALRVDLLAETIEVSTTFPPVAATPYPLRPLREPADLLEAMLHFQGNGFPRAGKGLVWDALVCIAERNAYHPVRDYLASLKWDRVERVGRLFQNYFQAELSPDDADQHERDRRIAYLEHVSICCMVAAVARVMRPGCKVDHLPVLVGPQGFGKSEGIRALCPDERWFSDDLSPDLMQRDTKESLVGKWIIELAEVPHVRREVERVKAFFSRRTDRYRRAYDRTTQDHPRQCVFIGTSNDLELIDVTGNRRFWPIEVAARIDIEAITRDRDQLWAEAVDLYRQGTRWWLAPKIEAIAAEHQDAFGEHDMWGDIIEEWIGERTTPLTMAELFSGCLGYADAVLIPKADQNRAAACLKRLGFRRRRRREGGSRAYRWEKTRVLSNPEKSGDTWGRGDSDAS